MALVVFMRGVNVGGHKKFQPAALARDLAAFGVVNIGAAGTFVVREEISQSSLRAETLRRLPFKAELMICSGNDIIDLVREEPFRDRGVPGKDARQFVSVMQKPLRTPPRLPLCRPTSDRWEVKVYKVSGQFSLSLWRRMGRTILYPNEVVEKNFGTPATTRGWNTISAIYEILGTQR